MEPSENSPDWQAPDVAPMSDADGATGRNAANIRNAELPPSIET